MGDDLSALGDLLSPARPGLPSALEQVALKTRPYRPGAGLATAHRRESIPRSSGGGRRTTSSSSSSRNGSATTPSAWRSSPRRGAPSRDGTTKCAALAQLPHQLEATNRRRSSSGTTSTDRQGESARLRRRSAPRGRGNRRARGSRGRPAGATARRRPPAPWEAGRPSPCAARTIAPYPFARWTRLLPKSGNHTPHAASTHALLSASRLVGVSAGARPARAAAAASRQASEGLVLAKELEALEEARRDRRAGEGETDRLKGLARLQAEPLGHVA